MDDFLAGADENPQEQSTDAVVVNQTASDEFGFMNEENPYDQVVEDQNDTMDQPPPQEKDDPFASMIDNPNDGTDALMGGDESNEIKQDEMTGTEQSKENANDEPTFLSVWQEERKLELEKRRNKEKEAQQGLLETAQSELEKFESDRAKRIENKKKENREKENDLREELDAVFKHGTIWEQVGKMVNLNEKMNGLSGLEKDRFRDLLIHLRNAKQ